MSALAEALLAAQRQAVGSLSKAFVADKLDADVLAATLDNIGLRDEVDQGLLIASLLVVKSYGGEAPKPTGANESRKAPEAAREAQLNLIKRLCKEKNLPEPDVVSSKDEASKIIDAIKDGTYNADAYTVPF